MEFNEGKQIRDRDERGAQEAECRRLKSLINSNQDEDLTVIAFKESLRAGKITKDDYIALTDDLFEKHEAIQGGLVQTAHNLTSSVDELAIDTATGLQKDTFLKSKLSNLIKELNYLPEKGEKKTREKSVYAIMVISVDLDNLKKWNDHGRWVGDLALKTLAKTLIDITRDVDSVFRRSDQSDEIMVTLKIGQDLNAAELHEIFKGIRRTINEEYIEVKSNKMPVTAATGYIVLRPGETREVEEIINSADANELSDKEISAKEERIKKAQEVLLEKEQKKNQAA